jgi:thiol-disulfide isomerase/thioredoxin
MLKGGYCHRGDSCDIRSPVYSPVIIIQQNHNTMKKSMYLLAAAVLFAFATESAIAQCGEEAVKAKLFALTFHADYCGACKALKPNVMDLQSKLDGEPVQWVKFDFTSAESKAKSEVMASKLGVADLYQENQATGFVLLVDADTKKTVGRLTSKQSSDEMYQTLKKNL